MESHNFDVNLSQYQNSLGRINQVKRLIWNIAWGVFARPLPRSFGKAWKRFLVRIFGGKIHSTATIYSTAKIYAPWNLVMDEYSCLASDVNCYNVDVIRIGPNSIISQGAYLCTASHDIIDPFHHLITAPIIIEDQVWVAAEAFIGMGVTIKQGAVIGARAVIIKNIEPWTVVAGNPAKYIKMRNIRKIC